METVDTEERKRQDAGVMISEFSLRGAGMGVNAVPTCDVPGAAIALTDTILSQTKPASVIVSVRTNPFVQRKGHLHYSRSVAISQT